MIDIINYYLYFTLISSIWIVPIILISMWVLHHAVKYITHGDNDKLFKKQLGTDEYVAILSISITLAFLASGLACDYMSDYTSNKSYYMNRPYVIYMNANHQPENSLLLDTISYAAKWSVETIGSTVLYIISSVGIVMLLRKYYPNYKKVKTIIDKVEDMK